MTTISYYYHVEYFKNKSKNSKDNYITITGINLNVVFVFINNKINFFSFDIIDE
jgi:hypothetical protein